MKALVHDQAVPHMLRLGDAPAPTPGPSQALIDVAAFSFNFGEVAFRVPDLPTGTIPGWDAAGTVVVPAADGSGPPAGSRVVTFGWGGAWAEQRAVDTAELALVPDTLDLGATAALPVAAVTALQAIRRLGDIAGRRVLVTGASGGVGRFAVQLAHLAGAEVVASVGSPARGAGLAELGASEVILGPAALRGRVFGAIDNVGGQQLADAYLRLETGGTVVAVGKASKQPTLIDFEEARIRVDRARIETFVIGTPLGGELAELVGLAERGTLDLAIGWRGDWTDYLRAADALVSRRVPGKAVLDVRRAD
ncbi:zinc-binding dehydrogenase [Nocardia sp. NPDC059764]|uniref:zinc-binding dehydrogenase n=1 Tax=Nocardia sp. NPDC059764 TaxID=3346939 RepID=UPI00364FD9A6